MSEKDNSICIIIDGKFQTFYLEKLILGYRKEYELDIKKLKIKINGIEYIGGNSREDM